MTIQGLGQQSIINNYLFSMEGININSDLMVNKYSEPAVRFSRHKMSGS